MTDTWHVYIIRCADDTLYTGITKNVDKRIQKHNAGNGAKYTKGRLPVKLVYKQKVGSYSAALKREHQIKSLPRKEKLAML